MDAKRSFDSNGAGAVVKRARFEGDSNDDGQQMVVSSDAKGRGQLVASVKRTSGLQAPIVRLDGHSAEVLDIQFDSTGEILASASTDKSINLWRVYGENANFGVLRAQNGAITSLAFTPSQSLVAASTDKTVATFDTERGEVVRRHRGHRAIVNCVDVTKGGNRELIASASDDGLVKIWDVEAKLPIDEVELGYPVTSVKWSEDGQQLFIGGIDNDIHCFDLRSKSVLYSLHGHNDTVTSLALSPSGTHLLSAAADDTCKIWDVRPFAPSTNASSPTEDPRQYRSLPGAPSGFEGWLRKASWDRDGSRVAVGGADRCVTIYNVEQNRLTHKLPGHTGFTTAIAFSPKDNIVCSAGTDSTIYLGEIPER